MPVNGGDKQAHHVHFIGRYQVNFAGSSRVEQQGRRNNSSIKLCLAVRFLSDNPDWFIESAVGTSWNQYLCNMSHQGTQADNIVIQAISDSMQLKMNIVESTQTFRETTIIEPTLCNDAENIKSVYIDHIGDMHYVSRCPVSP